MLIAPCEKKKKKKKEANVLSGSLPTYRHVLKYHQQTHLVVMIT